MNYNKEFIVVNTALHTLTGTATDAISKLEHLYTWGLNKKLHVRAFEHLDTKDLACDLKASIAEGGHDDSLVTDDPSEWLKLPVELDYETGAFVLKLAIPLTSPEREMSIFRFNGSPLETSDEFILEPREMSGHYLLVGLEFFGVMSLSEYQQCFPSVLSYVNCPEFRTLKKIPKFSDLPAFQKDPEYCLLALFLRNTEMTRTFCELVIERLAPGYDRIFHSGEGVYQVYSHRKQLTINISCNQDGHQVPMKSGQTITLDKGCTARVNEHLLGQDQFPSAVNVTASSGVTSVDWDAFMKESISDDLNFQELRVLMEDPKSELYEQRIVDVETAMQYLKEARFFFKKSEVIPNQLLRLHFRGKTSSRSTGPRLPPAGCCRWPSPSWDPASSSWGVSSSSPAVRLASSERRGKQRNLSTVSLAARSTAANLKCKIVIK